jgi:hypothetical protein
MPIANNILIINDVRVPKLLHEISIREMHNDLMKMKDEGGLEEYRHETTNKPIISDTSLQPVIKQILSQLQKASNQQKQICGCTTCLGMKYSHGAQNGYWKSQRK